MGILINLFRWDSCCSTSFAFWNKEVSQPRSTYSVAALCNFTLGSWGDSRILNGSLPSPGVRSGCEIGKVVDGGVTWLPPYTLDLLFLFDAFSLSSPPTPNTSTTSY